MIVRLVVEVEVQLDYGHKEGKGTKIEKLGFGGVEGDKERGLRREDPFFKDHRKTRGRFRDQDSQSQLPRGCFRGGLNLILAYIAPAVSGKGDVLQSGAQAM